MGTKKPDSIPMAVWRRSAETIGEMAAKGWAVQSHCPTCNLTMQVSLPDLIKLRGPRVSLWNEHPKCRKIGCGGRVDFKGKPPGGWGYRSLDSSPAFEAEEARAKWQEEFLRGRK